MRVAVPPLALVFMASLAINGCHCSDDSPPPDPCASVDCGVGSCMLGGDAGVAVCSCPTGYEFDGETCAPGPCMGIDCSQQGACVERDGSAVCDCEDGFIAVGVECKWRRHFGCEDLDCGEGSGCTTTDYGFACACPPGTRTTGTTCAPPSDNPCSDVACSGHGACVSVAGAPQCTCDAGYSVTSDGLACVPGAATESCVAVLADCAGELTFDSCCTGARCEYVASTGQRYVTGVDAEEHCLTGVAVTPTYASCTGTPAQCVDVPFDDCVAAGCLQHTECNGIGACSTFTDRASCEGGGCIFTELCGDPGGVGPEFGRSCGVNRNEASCDARLGCSWIPRVPVTAAAADSHCSALTLSCAPGRDYHLCCDNECEAVFEDGTVLRGTQSIVGYCRGELDAEDVAGGGGRCLSRCQQLTTESACDAADCSWNALVSECEGRNPQCFFQYDEAACDAYGPCIWFGGDEPIRVPDDGSVTAVFPPQVPPGSFVLDANPITIAQGEAVGMCFWPMARVVSIGGDEEEKVLPNSDYAMPAATPYRAVADGRVSEIRPLGPGENGVVVTSRTNPNMSYNYDHVGMLMVAVGDDVLAGDPIGFPLGESGVSGLELSVTEMLGTYGPIEACPQRFASSRYMAETRALQMLTNLALPDGQDIVFDYTSCYADHVFSF